jgi:hypothetical protein
VLVWMVAEGGRAMREKKEKEKKEKEEEKQKKKKKKTTMEKTQIYIYTCTGQPLTQDAILPPWSDQFIIPIALAAVTRTWPGHNQ